MPRFTQSDRPLAVETPLGPDVLLLQRIEGFAGVSEPFQFKLDLLAEKDRKVEFGKVLGRPMVVRLKRQDGGLRWFHGMVSRFVKLPADREFQRFRAVLVPRFQLFEKSLGSRIFQQMTVPEILQRVLEPLRPDVLFQFNTQYSPRDYCVQYQESDFAFANRLMEDEGIFYYFRHTATSHLMVVCDNPAGCPELEAPSVLEYESARGPAREPRITHWEMAQEITASKYIAWDQNFEMCGRQGRPFQNLEAQLQLPADGVTVGKQSHPLRFPANEDLEVFEYPGGFAHRFDGIGPQGQERSLDDVHADGRRTARIRLEQELQPSCRIDGTSRYEHLTPAASFKLKGLDDDDGEYLITRVEHRARAGGYRSGEEPKCEYENKFMCIPMEMPLRPERRTPKPRIQGPQTAVVVGVDRDRPFLDKYGRVKVQFHWDRHGKFDANSSCWIRVAQSWAGKRYGSFFWPRPGQEVVVAFEDGDPDRPLIVGSVYNASNMPPYELPKRADLSGIKSCAPGHNPQEWFNAVMFCDAPEAPRLMMHSHSHESNSSGSSRVQYTPGPATEFAGSLPFSVGSGSGGGYFSVGSIFAEFVLPRIPPLMPALKWLAANLPGKPSFVCGTRSDVTLVGGKTQYNLVGNDVNYVFDIFSTGGSPAGLLGGALDLAVLFTLPYIPGKVDLIYGPRITEIYWGPKFDITWCKTYTWKGTPFWGVPASPFDVVAKSMASLIFLTSTIGSLVARILGRNVDGGTIQPHEQSLAISQEATGTLHAWLQFLERRMAMAASAKGDAASALKRATEAAEETTWIAAVGSMANSIRNKLLGAKGDVQQGTETVGDIVPNVPQGTSSRDVEVSNGDKTIGAKTIALRASNTDNLVAVPSTLTMNGVQGTIAIDAERSASLAVGASKIGIDGTDVSILNAGTGTLLLQQGQLPLSPRIEIGSTSIIVDCAFGLIRLDADKILLQYGPMGPKIRMDPIKGIELSYGPMSGITIGPEGIKIRGPLLNFEAMLQATDKALKRSSQIGSIDDLSSIVKFF